MLDNFENIYLQRCDFLKLRFTYTFSNNKQSYKFDYLVRLLNFDDGITISVKNFLLSVLANIVAPFLYLQHQSVRWSAVSIIYESNVKNLHNLYLIPLRNVKGQVSTNQLRDNELKIFLRFQSNPRPTTVKIRGVSNYMQEDEVVIESHLKASEKAFTDTFFIDNTQVSYHYIHPQAASILSKLRKNKRNKQKLSVDHVYRKPILALTDL